MIFITTTLVLVALFLIAGFVVLKRKYNRFMNFKAIHAYVYGRWTYQYVGTLIKHILPRLKPKGKKWLSDRYHAKVLTPELAEALITHDHSILQHDMEQIIPYPMARDLILKANPDIVVYDCACRKARESHCNPLQVCMVVGKPFTSFTLKHHPESARRIDQKEAVELLKAEYERGHLHSAWFKDACGDRFFALCNCCKCCCMGVEAMMKHDTPMMASSGYVAVVDEESCAACSTCAEACPFDAIQVEEAAVINWDGCLGCGVCEGQCPSGAMSILRDEKKGVPLDVRLMD